MFNSSPPSTSAKPARAGAIRDFVGAPGRQRRGSQASRRLASPRLPCLRPRLAMRIWPPMSIFVRFSGNAGRRGQEGDESMSRHRKTKLVRLFDMLAGGSWRPDDGWDNARIKKNCELVADQGGFSSKVLPLACVAVELLAQRQPDTVARHHVCVRVCWLVVGYKSAKLREGAARAGHVAETRGDSVLLDRR